MTAVSDTITSSEPEQASSSAGSSRRPRWTRLVAPLGTCMLVALLAQLPVLHNRIFYFWDDSAAQFVPMWRVIGERVAAGEWPTLLDLNSWMGGNLAGEALFGVWNPVNIANYVLVARLPDLAVAATVVKTEYLVLLSLGGYLLCREYGAARWASSALAVAVPFAGFTLYFDASTWVAGLMSFAWLPLLWACARRMARGRMLAIWPFLFGFLVVSGGYPYGLLGVCVVVLGLLVEFLLSGNRSAVWQLLVLGLAISTVALLIYLPLIGNSTVSWRHNTVMYNDGKLVPSINDLVASSMPSYVPNIRSFPGGSMRMTVPATYFAWFLLPLLPWLSWGVLRTKWRELTGALIFGACYLLMSLGPSNLWLFRWPLRLVEYCFLGVAVLFAVLLSAGLRTDHVRRRALLTAATLCLLAYLSFAAWPKLADRHLVSLVLLSVLTALVVLAARRNTRWAVAVLHIGTASVLALQVTWFPGNRDVASYDFPTSVAELKSRFADRYQGTTFQLADWVIAQRPGPDAAWRDMLFGNMYRAAGVRSVTAYTGIGNLEFHRVLCLSYLGARDPRDPCADASGKPLDVYGRLWQPTAEGGPTLADHMRLQTVVVQRALIESPQPPSGWSVAQRTPAVTVLRRDADLPWPDGRLGWASPGITVTQDSIHGQRTETVVVRDDPAHRHGPGRLAFARIAWPGYHVEAGGVEIPAISGPAGLLQVQLPEGFSGEVRMHWRPPGLHAGIAATALGLVTVLALSLFQFLRRRRPFEATQ